MVTVVNKISKKIRDENHLYPTLSANEEYLKLEKAFFKKMFQIPKLLIKHSSLLVKKL